MAKLTKKQFEQINRKICNEIYMRSNIGSFNRGFNLDNISEVIEKVLSVLSQYNLRLADNTYCYKLTQMNLSKVLSSNGNRFALDDVDCVDLCNNQGEVISNYDFGLWMQNFNGKIAINCGLWPYRSVK